MPITLRLMSSLILFAPFHLVHLCPQFCGTLAGDCIVNLDLLQATTADCIVNRATSSFSLDSIRDVWLRYLIVLTSNLH